MAENDSPESSSETKEKDLEARVEKIMGEALEAPGPQPEPQPVAPAPVQHAPVLKESKEPDVGVSNTPASVDKIISEIGENDDSQIAAGEHHIPAPDPSIQADLVAQDELKPKVLTPIDLSALGPSDENGRSMSSAAIDARQTNMAVVMKDSWYARFGRLFKNKWLWLTVLAILALSLGLPQTRYLILGKFLKETVTVDIIDSKTKLPISDASVTIGGSSAMSNASGKAAFQAPLGKESMTVRKQYYQTASSDAFVGLMPAAIHVQLIATGRQVPVTVLNKISGKPVAGAEIRVLNTSAKTNSEGIANIVLPTKQESDAVTVSLSGYNTIQAAVQVTSGQSAANTFSLTPAGQVYFLSNLSGTLDVVKSNLDGSDVQTVLAGTGKENPNDTVLLASRDWQFLVLFSDRSGSPGAYVINTGNGKVSEFDSANATYTPVGWYGHDFIYDENSNTVPLWQNGHEVLKSYDADDGELNVLDQAQSGGSSAQYATQQFSNFFIQNGTVIYNTFWSGSSANYPSGAVDTLRSITASGQGKKDIQSQQPGSVSDVNAVLGSPVTIDLAYYNSSSANPAYYQYAKQAVSSVTDLNASLFAQPAPSYLFSPSNSLTFWGEQRDGKINLIVGDQNGENQKTILSLGTFSPYGWYGDTYLIVSKNNDELFIMPADGLAGGHQPLQVSGYYQSPLQYPNIEYSYGGL